jgi:hypothetical protein
MRIAIMQPTYLPWLGYFDLMDQADLFVLLDNVQFAKQTWQQRNRIKNSRGLEWLTVPVQFRGRFGQTIAEVEIRDADFWKKHARTLEVNYGRAEHFRAYFPELWWIYEENGPWSRLVDLNIALMEWVRSLLVIKTPMVRASELDAEGKRSGRVASICRSVGATEYLSPIGAAGYVLSEMEEFSERGIQVFFQNYTHPAYRQLFPPFLPYASVIDCIFNEGARSGEITRSGRGNPYLPDEVPVRVAENQVENDAQV